MKKILIINNFFSSFTGSDVMAFKEFQLLEEKGHEVYFYAVNREPYFIKDYKYAKYFPKYKKHLKINLFEKIKIMLNPLRLIRPFYNFEAEKNLKKYIDDVKPDIVHCHSIYFHLSPSVLKACYDKKIPVIITLHAGDLICPTGFLMKGDKELCKEALCENGNILHCYKNLCDRSNFILGILKSLIYFYYKISGYFEKANHYITPSEALRKLITKKYLPANKVTTINNYIESNAIDNTPSLNKGYFLFVGRLSKVKGIHYLIEAMTGLPHINLHIIGRGPDEEELKSLVNKLELKNIVFLGFKSGNELKNEYKDSIATILPCNWFENFPTTILESFLHKKAVIASNIGGIPEMIDHNINGLLIEPGNIEQLTAAIKFMNENSQKTIEMGENGSEKAELKFNKEKHYNELIKLINNIG